MVVERKRERDGVVVVKIRWKEPSAGGGLIVALVLERDKKGRRKARPFNDLCQYFINLQSLR